jgi:hypothetical protein
MVWYTVFWYFPQINRKYNKNYAYHVCWVHCSFQIALIRLLIYMKETRIKQLWLFSRVRVSFQKNSKTTRTKYHSSTQECIMHVGNWQGKQHIGNNVRQYDRIPESLFKLKIQCTCRFMRDLNDYRDGQFVCVGFHSNQLHFQNLTDFNCRKLLNFSRTRAYFKQINSY